MNVHILSQENMDFLYFTIENLYCLYILVFYPRRIPNILFINNNKCNSISNGLDLNSETGLDLPLPQRKEGPRPVLERETEWKYTWYLQIRGNHYRRQVATSPDKMTKLPTS